MWRALVDASETNGLRHETRFYRRMTMEQHRVRSAAIRLRTGEVFEGDNHRAIREMIYAGNGGRSFKAEEGFVLGDGRFVDRHEGATIALATGQVSELSEPSRGLTSGDI